MTENINSIQLDDQQLNSLIFMYKSKVDKDQYEKKEHLRFLKIQELRVEHHTALSNQLDILTKLRDV